MSTHPIAAASEMGDRWTKRVRLLGEDLVLFKDRGGRLGLVHEFCPHRRASLAYGFAQYMIQEDHNAEKKAIHDKSQECYAKVIAFADAPIEKVEIPFADNPAYDASSFPGLLHLPKGKGPWPCVIFIPGTDMHKEQIPNPEDNIFVKRGMACLSIDGPGQGESLVRMLKVRVDTWNYERAVSAAIDYLQSRPEIDGDRIATVNRLWRHANAKRPF